jgi:AraC-like DNA-binding protein
LPRSCRTIGPLEKRAWRWRTVPASTSVCTATHLAQEIGCTVRHLETCLREDLGVTFHRLGRLRVLCDALDLHAAGVRNSFEIEARAGASARALDRTARGFLV